MADLRFERKKDFLNKYGELVKALGLRFFFISREDLIRLTLMQKAKRTYVSEERAMFFVKEYLKDPLNYFNTIKSEYSYSLQRHVIKRSIYYLALHYPFFTAVYKAIHEEAPSFFVSYRTARDYLFNDYYDRRIKLKTSKRT